MKRYCINRANGDCHYLNCKGCRTYRFCFDYWIVKSGKWIPALLSAAALVLSTVSLLIQTAQ